MPRSVGVVALCALGLAAGADAARGPSVTEHIKMSTESATAKPTRRRPSEVWSPEKAAANGIVPNDYVGEAERGTPPHARRGIKARPDPC